MTFDRRWVLLFALGIIPLLMVGHSPAWALAVLAWNSVLVGLVLVDWLLLPAPEMVEVVREMGDRLSLGTENSVSLRVHNRTGSPIHIDLIDSPPASMITDLDERPFAFTVQAGGRHEALYHVRPTERGDYKFGDAYVRLRGRMQMVSRIVRVPLEAGVRVFPNVLETEKFTMMARRGRLQQIGIRKARLQGAGREFESLRDYVPDDELRRIDWKATARRGHLVSRQYEVEKSQNVMLVIDVGRTMLAEIDGIQKLEYAINAALLLAYVATLADDKVGLLLFADTVRTYLPPRKGQVQVHAILEALYNVKATLAEPDYRSALAYLQYRWRRRSLMVCFTDLWDPDSSRTTIAELAALQPRHLVAAVTLLDTKVLRAADQPIVNPGSAFRKAVASQVLDDRRRATGALTQRGVLVVDSAADSLSAALVNKYLEAKQRMML